jgi:hypothetical protein
MELESWGDVSNRSESVMDILSSEPLYVADFLSLSRYSTRGPWMLIMHQPCNQSPIDNPFTASPITSVHIIVASGNQ